jgi:alpha-tubulin suppressor-like RCC1 family protein
VTTQGGVRCWGYNAAGQLGDGTLTQRSVPVAVAGLGSAVTAITTNHLASCGRTAFGSVLCWGWVSGSTPGPVVVPGLASGVAAIDANAYGLCALTTGGAVACEQYDPPIFVAGLEPGATAVAMGGSHDCALLATGGVRCWGLNVEGQLGDGGSVPYSAVAVDVTGLASGIMQLATGGDHSCALRSGGDVWCWGRNYDGELGDGSQEQRSTPVAVVGLPAGVVALSAGFFHTCALTSGGAVWCWGSDASAQLGDPDPSGWSALPIPVAGLSGATALSSGGYHNCALTSSGGIRCWGSNWAGQLGNDSLQNSEIPLGVVGFYGALDAPALGAPGLVLLVATLLGVGASQSRRARPA